MTEYKLKGDALGYHGNITVNGGSQGDKSQLTQDEGGDITSPVLPKEDIVHDVTVSADAEDDKLANMDSIKPETVTADTKQSEESLDDCNSPIAEPFNNDDPDAIMATASDYSKNVNSEVAKLAEWTETNGHKTGAMHMDDANGNTPIEMHKNVDVAPIVVQKSPPKPKAEMAPKPSPKVKKKQSAKKKTRIFIANINSNIGDNQLKTKFERFGAIVSSKIIKDPTTNASKGRYIYVCLLFSFFFNCPCQKESFLLQEKERERSEMVCI